ncbi:MAG: tRNA (adenosine(37)-N6)-threonylcarbamoyltransferase complex transferase subunit TsaD [Candidatus Lambdaproteobacteria bacterium RIFOXYD1_FULL_56_27]|uniref:tRNA N6-adenosine threonylcarbamoyltransferase n=1 Tax=Candidatus Lambdaproteobacteria bacterium RIFOXYD2_FULL_56_26 TaxID=1817773 RepID=A0A1F6H2T3_9PROT|nr:MAG: tRNA (adenosine(37)-N6)-threonylcarbamoyltransferase complex transferase subunit TsaD [Candidatus Lambdaproteobacteria bacterium RIFOXYC1_FULL_56_13]OGH04675.1 MAG: tRNA (adenosine(37)-N6)-threonylcarbamoyltransferase complex transferase subunit TsaD [Candidatus Lambdaproteobacteria bacterium RIFOXYD2_FULL_56_26]OGH09139.1 MAG: tRNA (adenosine(37)-N6)-threonylcarbamoyltransferase complex transferase subunit TsaD [Candidatus Lambdaproteobacteria bacterium RIFOXYD1_FULL_56_27]
MILAIETSCDDSALALIGRQGEVVYESLSSQVDFHGKYGGVVPEIASRRHLLTLPLLFEELKAARGLKAEEIRAIAVTQAPGLVGSILVGLSWAKALAWAWDKPLVAVDHLEGHLLAARLDHPELEFPFLSLIASGGHTHLVLAEGLGRYRLLGKTLDDALGEAYDKVAKLLGFEYPGGPILDKIANSSKTASTQFTLPLQKHKTLNFSFSGIKTAVLNEAIARNLRVENLRLLGYSDFQALPEPSRLAIADLVNSFQTTAAKIVVQRFEQALAKVSVQRISLTGGVAANSALRQALGELAQKRGLEFYCPLPKHCTDNAAMIGQVAFEYLKLGTGVHPNPLSLGASPKSPMGLMELDLGESLDVKKVDPRP